MIAHLSALVLYNCSFSSDFPKSFEFLRNSDFCGNSDFLQKLRCSWKLRFSTESPIFCRYSDFLSGSCKAKFDVGMLSDDML